MESQYPLFSTIVTLYTIIFIYFPTIAASPLIISTSVLLLSLLRLGAAQRISQKKNKKPESEILSLQISADSTKCENDSVLDQDPDLDPIDSNVDSSNCEKDSVFEPDSEQRMFHADESRVDSSCEKDSVLEPESRLFHGDCFVEWNVRAPLEVIYEAYEGEEDGEYTEEKRDEELRVIEKYASLSMYYPETDTDSSSDGDSPVIGNWDSPENVCFQWDDEDREELIEIELDCKRNSEVEEENLIEIDLSPANFPVR